jgi:enoyl-CoA hydratase/carnithine racemase
VGAVKLPELLNAASLGAFSQSLKAEAGPWLLEGQCLGMDPSAQGQLEPMLAVLQLLHGGPASLAFVRGKALGGGLGLVAACDWVCAHPQARFGLPELTLGLLPGCIAPALMARVGAGGLRRLAVGAASISAEEAMQMGLVDEVCERPQRAFRHLSRLDPHALRALRRLMQPDYRAQLRAGATLSARFIAAAGPRLERSAAGEAPWSE